MWKYIFVFINDCVGLQTKAHAGIDYAKLSSLKPIIHNLINMCIYTAYTYKYMYIYIGC